MAQKSCGIARARMAFENLAAKVLYIILDAKYALRSALGTVAMLSPLVSSAG